MDIEKICMGCMKEITQPGICPHCGYHAEAAKAEGHYLRPYSILNGKYLVGKVLGEGGFGITYIGCDLNLEMPVAIKEFYPNGFVTRESSVTSMVSAYRGTNMEAVQKWKNNFIKEARTLAKCAHLSGIVGVKDFFEENGTAYIVMEYLEGMTLKDYVKSCGGRVETGQLLKYLEPVMAALDKVHEYGVIHRDISPDNIMLLQGGTMKLLDFGAARDYAAENEKSLSVMLKPGYAPEEQYRTKGKQGPWSDVYAFCATIYKCITGITPPESMERMRQDELLKPGELGISLSPQIEDALLKGMAVYAENRYQSMQELMTALFGGNREALMAVPLTQSQTMSGQMQPSSGTLPAQKLLQSPVPDVPSVPVTEQDTAKGEKVSINLKDTLNKLQTAGQEHKKALLAAAGILLVIIVIIGIGRGNKSDIPKEAQVQNEKVQTPETDMPEKVVEETAASVQESAAESAEELIRKGRELMEKGDYESAFACLEEAREIAPEKEEIYSYESDIYLKKNDIVNAAGILEEGVEKTGKMTLDTRKSYILQNAKLKREEEYLGDIVVCSVLYDGDENVVCRDYYTETGHYMGRTEYVYEKGSLLYEISYRMDEQLESEVFYDNGLEIAGNSFDEQGQLTQSYSCEYDGQGRMNRRVYYHSGSVVGWWKDYEYDENGNQIKDSSYNPDGSLSSWQEYYYNADGTPQGYKAYYANGSQGGSGGYSYDEQGNCIEHADYNADGYENWREEYEYDALGNVSRRLHYDYANPDPSYVFDYVYTYEFQGN